MATTQYIHFGQPGRLGTWHQRKMTLQWDVFCLSLAAASLEGKVPACINTIFQSPLSKRKITVHKSNIYEQKLECWATVKQFVFQLVTWITSYKRFRLYFNLWSQCIMKRCSWEFLIYLMQQKPGHGAREREGEGGQAQPLARGVCRMRTQPLALLVFRVNVAWVSRLYWNVGKFPPVVNITDQYLILLHVVLFITECMFLQGCTHRDELEGGCHLGCSADYSGRRLPTL